MGRETGRDEEMRETDEGADGMDGANGDLSS
jgi:hypothetical protein